MVTQRLTRGRSGGVKSPRSCWPVVTPVNGSVNTNPELESGVPGLISKILVLSEQVCKQHVIEVSTMQNEITKLRYQLERSKSELGKFKSGISNCGPLSALSSARGPGSARLGTRRSGALFTRRNSAPAVMAYHGSTNSRGPLASSSIYAAGEHPQPISVDFQPLAAGLRNTMPRGDEEPMQHIAVNDERNPFFSQASSIAKVVHFFRQQQERDTFLPAGGAEALRAAAKSYSRPSGTGIVTGAAWRGMSGRGMSEHPIIACSEGIVREDSGSSRTESPPPCVALESAAGEVAVKFRIVGMPSSSPVTPHLKLSPLGCHRARTSGQIEPIDAKFPASCLTTPRSYTPRHHSSLSQRSSGMRSPKGQERQISRPALIIQDFQSIGQIPYTEPQSGRTLSGRTLSTRTVLSVNSMTKESETPDVRVPGVVGEYEAVNMTPRDDIYSL